MSYARFYSPVLTLLIIFTLTGCVTSEPAVKRTQPVKQQMSYVYGTFQSFSEKNTDGAKIALELIPHNNPKKSAPIFVEFKEDNALYSVEIPAGYYEFGKIVFLSRNDAVAGSISMNKRTVPTNVGFNFEPGMAYYLGDFRGQIARKYMGMDFDFSMVITHFVVIPTSRGYRYFWELTQLNDNFDQTTKLLQENYDQFASMEKVNLLKQFHDKISEEIIEKTIKQVEKQGELEQCTLLVK